MFLGGLWIYAPLRPQVPDFCSMTSSGCSVAREFGPQGSLGPSAESDLQAVGLRLSRSTSCSLLPPLLVRSYASPSRSETSPLSSADTVVDKCLLSFLN
jgi:hypothetical protein